MIRHRSIAAIWFAFGIVCAAELWAATGGPPADAAGASSRPGITVEPAKELTWLELLQKGGPVMYPLYLCSIVMVAFAIERTVNLRRKKIMPADVVARLREVCGGNAGALDTDMLLAEFRERDNPLARIVAAGLRRARNTVPEIEKAIEDAGGNEAAAMLRNCKILSVVSTVAPLLGLLGTVTGMVRAFMTVAARQEALGRTELLAAGIYEALVTTVVGLVIAIPAVVLYHVFQDRVHRLVAEIDVLTTDLVEKIRVSQLNG